MSKDTLTIHELLYVLKLIYDEKLHICYNMHETGNLDCINSFEYSLNVTESKLISKLFDRVKEREFEKLDESTKKKIRNLEKGKK